MRVGYIAFIFALVITILMSPSVRADSLHDLLVVYRCEVVNRLEQIYLTGNPASHRNRYLAISVPRRIQAYVQCIFHDNNTKIYCEAASGFWYSKKGEPRTFRQTPEAIDALAGLGFDIDDSAGNFNIDREIGTPPDFNALADFMLRALHDGYGARGNMNLEFNAPFAPKAPSTCVPVS